MRSRRISAILMAALLILASCSRQESSKLKIDYEKYTLGNGLQVILHEDRSDPIASVAILYHVGSNREEVGRTGFAHLFEHMLFQESKHVGQDQFFKKIQQAGGTLNGGTWQDGTIYYEVVPNNALEMVLWLESDRMGYLLSTVTQEAFKNQQEVVQNEKRQRVDNVPYGHTSYVIDKLLYPQNHPYNWQVIGSFDDLQNATIADIHNFYKKWYGPNNATLVVAGDFDKAQIRQWIEKYFGELKSSPPVESPKPMPVTLSETKRAFHEDNFARSPELNMVFPTVEEYQKDSYALDFLAELFADGKKAPLYKVVVEEKKLAPSVSAFQNSSELAGVFRIRIRAFPQKNLTEVEKAIFEAFDKFEKDGFTQEDLDRIKAKTETQFYNGISSVLGKSFQLAAYNTYTGSPDFISQDIQNKLAVTAEDVWRVYKKYIKGRHYVLTSFVPKGQADLVAENSQRFPVVEEPITGSSKPKVTQNVEMPTVDEPESKFDRSVQPAQGPAPEVKVPGVWSHTYANGMKLYGIEQKELPLVQFSLTVGGGLLFDAPDQVGVANLISDLMMEGTANKTPLELEEAIDDLGARISMYTTKEAIVLQGNTLSRKLDKTYALAEEILLQPRWDEKEFDRVKKETIETIHRRNANPPVIARNLFNKLLYGEDNILGNATLGTAETVEKIDIQNLKRYYDNYFSPSLAYIGIVGDISKDRAIKLFAPLAEKWPAKDVKLPEPPAPQKVEQAKVYFFDVPNAKQSQIRIGYLALAYTDPDYYPAVVMNYKLGGSFSGILNLILREEKGYTYGARSGFSGTRFPGPFTASAGVRSNATFESVEIFKDEMTKYRQGISADDLAFTKSALIQSNARRFETLGALLGMLNRIAVYGLPADYVKQQEKIIRDMSLEQHKALAQKYIRPDKMIYLVVGDAKTQMQPLAKLGLGNPILLTKRDNPTATGTH